MFPILLAAALAVDTLLLSPRASADRRRRKRKRRVRVRRRRAPAPVVSELPEEVESPVETTTVKAPAAPAPQQLPSPVTSEPEEFSVSSNESTIVPEPSVAQETLNPEAEGFTFSE